MVTVEAAIAMGAGMMVLMAMVLALAVGSAKGNVCQAAREAARSYSLGGASSAPQPSSRSIDIVVDEGAPWFSVTASSSPFVLGQWAAPAVTCSVTAMREPYARWIDTGGW